MKKQQRKLVLLFSILISVWSYGQTLDCTITASANPICLGDTAVLSVNSNPLETVYWSDGSVGLDSIEVFPTQTTTYDVIISDGVNSCTQNITVVVNNPQINAGQDQQVCEGTQFTLTATGAVTYSWDNVVVNGQPFTFTTEGYYTVIGTDALGCSNTVSVFLDLIHPSSSSISPAVCNSYTAPDGVVYTNSGIYTAVIPNSVGCDSTITINLIVNTPNSGTDTKTVCDSLVWIDGITYLENNNSATFVLQNMYGCDSLVTLNLTINKLADLNAGEDVSVCLGQSVTLNASGAATYNWSNNVSNGASFNPILGITTVSVIGADVNGCNAKDELSIEVKDCFSIPNGFSPNGDNVNDTWKVEGLWEFPEASLVVFDRWGKKVFEGDANNNSWDGKINGNELPSADYYYVIELGNGENYKGTVTLKR
jgi:gliding motility-associated-like protein